MVLRNEWRLNSSAWLWNERPTVTVAAQTLPEENASTSVLKKLRFRLTGTLEHPDDGLVWEWQLSDTSEA